MLQPHHKQAALLESPLRKKQFIEQARPKRTEQNTGRGQEEQSSKLIKCQLWSVLTYERKG